MLTNKRIYVRKNNSEFFSIIIYSLRDTGFVFSKYIKSGWAVVYFGGYAAGFLNESEAEEAFELFAKSMHL